VTSRQRIGRAILDSQGFVVSQDDYNGLVRAVGNLSALVVHLEDKIDALTLGEGPLTPEPTPLAGSTGLESPAEPQVELE
jgi:hypothetical protein